MPIADCQAPALSIKFLHFNQLGTHTLYALLRLRVDVFVVEQQCPYPELDGLDTLESTVHVLGYVEDKLVACARLLDTSPVAGPKTGPAAGSLKKTAATAAIGRVIVHQTVRKAGYGRTLMLACINRLQEEKKVQTITLSAQTAALDFYHSLGFTRCSAPYDEDGIEHVDMRLQIP